jgi:hypothetical protein
VKRAVRWVAVIAVAAAAVAMVWTLHHVKLPRPGRMTIVVPPTTAEPSPPPPVQTSARPEASPPVAKISPRHLLPDSRTPLGEAVETLRAYAEEGDADAAVELSWRLSACTERALRRSDESAEGDRRMIEDDKSDDRLSDELRAARKENVQRRIDERIQLRRDCRALPADLRDGWLEWIDRAAQAGNTAAMRGYARMAIGEYYSASDVRADIDEAIERRDKARAYLAEALRRGDADALVDLANAYSPSGHPTIYPDEPSEAYAYAYASTLAGLSRGRWVDDLMERAARSLDGKQLAAAEAKGRRLYEQCCAGH